MLPLLNKLLAWTIVGDGDDTGWLVLPVAAVLVAVKERVDVGQYAQVLTLVHVGILESVKNKPLDPLSR
jgi:hypothetical protein